jgi:hypothetical protein
LDTWRVSNKELSTATNIDWHVEKRTLRGGKQEGVDIIEIDNGSLVITVVPTRGMSVFEVRKGGIRLGWDSPVKEIVHPHYINLESRSGLGWLEGFNEWMVRCGLEFAGHPGLDEFITNTGDKSRMMLTLHGKIGNIPASEVEVSVDETPPFTIRVRGIVQEKVFHGPKLELITEISTTPGSDAFRIDDKVVNRSAYPQEFQIIYHINYGRPLLQEGAKLVVPASRVTPMNQHAANAIEGYQTYLAPQPGFIEEVFLIEPIAGPDDTILALLRSKDGELGASIEWPASQLPYLTQWKNTASLEDGYVTGLEPGTGYPFNRSVERKFDRVPILGPGASRGFTLDFQIHDTRETVRMIEERIEKIQGGHKTILEQHAPGH